jgi:hypothetical protein
LAREQLAERTLGAGQGLNESVDGNRAVFIGDGVEVAAILARDLPNVRHLRPAEKHVRDRQVLIGLKGNKHLELAIFRHASIIARPRPIAPQRPPCATASPAGEGSSLIA